MPLVIGRMEGVAAELLLEEQTGVAQTGGYTTDSRLPNYQTEHYGANQSPRGESLPINHFKQCCFNAYHSLSTVIAG